MHEKQSIPVFWMLRHNLYARINTTVQSPAGASAALAFQWLLCSNYLAPSTLLLETLASMQISYSPALVGLYLPVTTIIFQNDGNLSKNLSINFNLIDF